MRACGGVSNMGIKKEKKIIKEEIITTYECDILYKEIAKDDIYKNFGGDYGAELVSKEAMELLPVVFRHMDDLLKKLVRAWPTKKHDPKPQVLNEGVWLMSQSGHIRRGKEEGLYPEIEFSSVDEAIELLNKLDTDEAWIFEDGNLVRHLRQKTIYVEVPLPPNEVAIHDPNQPPPQPEAEAEDNVVFGPGFDEDDDEEGIDLNLIFNPGNNH